MNVRKLLKQGASLYLKCGCLNLSIAIILKTFHWFKNDESYSVVCVALLVSLLLRQQKVILCCCETTFLIIAELTYSLTYQIIISPILPIPDSFYTHFVQKKLFELLMHFYISYITTRGGTPGKIWRGGGEGGVREFKDIIFGSCVWL